MLCDCTDKNVIASFEMVHRNARKLYTQGGGPRVVASTASFHARVRDPFPGLGGLKRNKDVSSLSTRKTQYCGSLRDGDVACSASDLQGWNFESCVWRAVSSHSSHHLQKVLLAQFSLFMDKSSLKPDFISFYI